MKEKKNESKLTHEEYNKSFEALVDELKTIRKSCTQIGYFMVEIDGIKYISISGKLDYVKDFFADGASGFCYET